MSSNPGTLSLFEYKIAALLHDPVDKAWILAGHGSHEKAALDYSLKILNGTSLEKPVESILNRVEELRGRHVVGYADALASTIDRWIISLLTTFRDDMGRPRYIRGVFEVQYTGKLKNIIDPRFYSILRKPEKEHIEEFTGVLNSVLTEVKGSVRLVYHLLYALYEPVFYDKVGSKYEGFTGSVADTRVPTHTVFDHAYASASIVNITYHGREEVSDGSVADKLDGYVVIVDLAGVQKFISASRKLRDLWISSWLASALTWATIWPLVYALGPDIMISPSPRNNPFYYSTLLAILKSKLKDTSVEKIEEYFAKAAGQAGKDIPKFGVMPSRVVLLLPREDIIVQGLREAIEEEAIPEALKNTIEENIKASRGNVSLVKLIVDIYRTLWSTIVDEAGRALLNANSRVMQVLRKILVEFNCWSEEDLEKVFNIVKSNPPLPIRIVVLNVKQVLEEAISRRGELEEYEVYDILVGRALEELEKLSVLKLSYPPSPPIEELYEYITKTSSRRCGDGGLSGKGYEYCSICGVMPAIIRMPSTGDWDSLKEKLTADSGIKLDVIEPIISPGERLCVYDLLKRILTIQDEDYSVLSEVVKKIINKNMPPVNLGWFPSTSHIALVEFYDTLARAYVEFHNESKELYKELDKTVSDLIIKLIEIKPSVKARGYALYKYPEILKNKLSIELGKDYEEASFSIIVDYINPETHILSIDGRGYLRELREFLERRDKQLLLNTYYSIIRADADNMGKLLSGQTHTALQLDPVDYIKEALEGSVKEIVELVIEGRIREAKERLVSCYKGKVYDPEGVAESNLGRLQRLLEAVRRLKRIPLTPTYHATISRSLMINALIDQYIVEEEEKGFIVYSGGDDLLALSPVSTSIPIALKTRRTFSLGHYDTSWKPKGFTSRSLLEKIGLASYVVPLVVTGGRSYSIVYVHYRYPLYASLRISHELLEEKDEIKWIIGEAKFSKDMLSVAYVPRGHSISTTILPFKQRESSAMSDPGGFIEHYSVGDVVDELINSWREIESNVVTKSLIYDLQREKEVIGRLLKEDSRELYYKFVEYVVSRNVSKSKGTKVDVKHLHITRSLEDFTSYLIFNKKEHGESIILNVIDFFKIYSSASRGVE